MRLIVKPQSQGATNGCGTTALSMAMEYWRPGALENERKRIDEAVRPFDLFTAPGDLIRYARQSGFQASLLADAQFNDLFGLLDRSIPVIVVVNSGQSLHYMLAVGYDTDPLQLHFADPASGGILTLEPSEFDAMWRDLTLRGLPTCVNRLLIAIAPPRKLKLAELLPIRPLESAGAVLLAALAIKDIAIGLQRKDPARLLGGVIEAISCVPGAFGNLLAGLGSEGRKRAGNSVTWLAALFLSTIGWSLQLLGMPLSWGGAGPWWRACLDKPSPGNRCELINSKRRMSNAPGGEPFPEIRTTTLIFKKRAAGAKALGKAAVIRPITS